MATNEDLLRELSQPAVATITKRAKFIILAGTVREAEHFSRDRQMKRSDWKYASSPMRILGLSNVDVYVVGTFWDRRDADEIMEHVKMSFGTGTVTLHDLTGTTP